MNKGRTIMRVVLVVMLIGLIGIAYRIWAKRQPSFYWNKAQSAIKKEDWESARLHLRNLLQKHPAHFEGHEQMARTILNEARSKNFSSSLGSQPGALHHLAEAAKLQPENIDLQKEVLSGYVNARMLGQALEYAEKIYKIEPTHPDAHFVMMWKAVEQKDKALAEELFEVFPNVQTRRVFHSLRLKAQYHHEAGETEEYEKALGRVAEFADKLTSEQLGLLVRSDREQMLRLLLGDVARTEDPNVAHRRAVRVVEACEKLQKDDLLPIEKLADVASKAVGVLNLRHPVVSRNEDAQALRTLLSERVGALAIKAVEAGKGTPIIYWQAAQTAFNTKKNEQGLQMLRDGIKTLEAQDPDQPGLNDLHLLAARRLIVMRRFPEAEEHLKVLVEVERFAGWAHLLYGSVALHQGRLEIAQKQFSNAQRKLGNQLKVRMALAHTHMAMQEWDKAIPLLESLDDIPFEDLPLDEQAWAKRLLGSGERVHFDLLRANLAMKRWKSAQEHLAALKQTEIEPKAWILAIAFLWQEEEKEKASLVLSESRKKFPDDMGLLMLQVRLLEEQKKPEAARNLLEAFVEEQPQEFSRQLTLARWRLRRGHNREALTQLDALRNRPDLTEAQARSVDVHLTQALIATGQSDRAMAMVEKLRNDPSSSVAADLLEVKRSLQIGDLVSANAAMERTTEAVPNSGQISLAHAKMAGSQGDWSAAVDSAARSIDVTKMRDKAIPILAQSLSMLARSEGLDVAAQKLDNIIERYPQMFELLVIRADFHLRKGELDHGVAMLERAEVLAPKEKKASLAIMKAKSWLNQNNQAQATKAASEAVKAEPDSINIILDAARIFLVAEDFDQALTLAGKARAIDQDSPGAYYVGAAAYRGKDEPAKAIRMMEALVARRPDDAQSVLSLASAQEANGDPTGALSSIRAARLKHPDDFRFVLSEISYLLKLNQPQTAERIARESKLESENPAELLALAQTFADQGQLGTAQFWGEKSFTKAKRSQQLPIHLFLGKVYLRRGQEEKRESFFSLARNHFEQVRNVQPRNLVAGNNLAWLLSTQFDRASEAVAVVEAVRGSAPVNRLPAQFIDTMGMAYRLAGRNEEAIKILQSGVERYPEDSQLQYQLGMALVGKGQKSPARSAFQKALELGIAGDQAKETREQLANLDISS